ncbi:MAG: UDP-N-acetylmuramate-L-alanine ligase [Candidatus Roizmanbacteria bacterium GW2011_GWA2_36_23]|uniref:UDP-N-acetylmuramate--L-alanine ligase n=1 Tax=Candidatus Roizmanbacteria bacterium GW2011_GWA2_36_23 TaxID=1618480 RepID=A0A0G0ELD9_9BACT|nr:MAG: UDP-N-acetylmuramate-L-alanine ligase [Candidatus Roizmanbacteria bacterium GW2011_GWA2_36_23]
MLKKALNIFIVGIKGVAMANLAVILKKMGKKVTGSDIVEEFITDDLLKKNSIKWSTGFDKDNLDTGTDLVIFSGANKGIENQQIKEAKKRKIKISSQAEIIGMICDQFKYSIAVSGCHGKTTTSSLLTYALINLKAKPSYLVGTPFFTDNQGSDYNSRSDYFVVEADEYGISPPINKSPKFFFLRPSHIICTNIDFDHPDIYGNLDETKKAFYRFFTSSHPKGDRKSKIIACVDDQNIREILKVIPRSQFKTYGFSKEADYRIINAKTNESGSTFRLTSQNSQISEEYSISLFGDKNVSNSVAVVATLTDLGFASEKIREAIRGFGGASRRFEKVFYKNDIFLFDDYAHHPAEIETVINSARSRFKNRRIVVIFQPHTYSRTKVMLSEFSRSLSLADMSIVLPIFASARENPGDFDISAEDIVSLIIKNFPGKNAVYINDITKLAEPLAKYLKKGDIIFTVGAGDVYKLRNFLIPLISDIIIP